MMQKTINCSRCEINASLSLELRFQVERRGDILFGAFLAAETKRIESKRVPSDIFAMLRYLVLCAALCVAAEAIKHDLGLVDDIRSDFIIEKFGLGNRGQLNFNITKMVVRREPTDYRAPKAPLNFFHFIDFFVFFFILT
jgi:hypothetical protein